MLNKSYDPSEAESRLYDFWESNGLFHCNRVEGETFSIVIPPPNITGNLHMGHALNNTLQDIIVRFQRMKGKNVLWQPGTDHAGIATQMLVERKLLNEDNKTVAAMDLLVPKIGEIIENGRTLLENALIKAKTVHKLTNLPALADDTGLEVDILNGQPGIYSARYAGEKCSYSDNVNKLLQEMDNISSDKRIAHFCTAIAYVDDNMELVTEGTVQGLITDKRKGIDGFGYDPVFYVPNMKKTYAEMSMDEKNQKAIILGS